MFFQLIREQAKPMNLLENLEKKSDSFILLTGFTLIGAVGLVDYLTGYEFAFSVFYVLPIFMIAWLTGRRFGIAASITSALIWLIADVASGNPYSSPFIPVWNTFIRLSFFVITTLLTSALRKANEREGELARLDYLTGAVNSRFFYELAQMEIDRSQRYKHPFTLAYIDLDNFKTVNDQFGHATGDLILCTMVSSARKFIRKTDVFARLGGDEFILLMPETGQESAHAVISRLQSGLLEEMRQNNCPITFSIGVLTCNIATPTTNELVRMADNLIYSVKNEGKNAIKYATYTGK
jgi:diguanylate cyclase (GGDEF)-like protein